MSGSVASLLAVALAGLAGILLVPGRPAVLARLGRGSPATGPSSVEQPARPRWRGGRQRAREAQRQRAVVGELLSALVAELRSGAEPGPALVAAARGLAGLDELVAAAARPTGDVPAALAALARRPGGSTAGDLAAAWRVGALTGCGLADPVARVLHGHRGEDRLRREVAAELAGPRATAWLLSGLPMVGVALGVALGADPAGFLLGTAPGRLVLVLGLALVLAGFWWTRQITDSATAAFVGGPGGTG